MPVNDADFKALQDSVREIDSALRGLKLAATALGLTGAVLAALLAWVFHTAWDANSTADSAREKATDASASVAIATQVGISRINTATQQDIDKLSTLAQEMDSATIQGISSISSAESAAKARLQDFVASSWTDEMNWAQRDDKPKNLNVKEGEGVCFLTRMAVTTGHFGRGVDEVRIEVQGGEFVLTGDSDRCCVAAAARCLRFAPPIPSSPP